MKPSPAFSPGRPDRVRISFSVLLRLAEDDRFVLFDAPKRPGAFGPPGGVVKYFPPAGRILDSLGFQPERTGSPHRKLKADLRGILPGGALRRFRTWFASGSYRETADECLRRELREELAEVGVHGLDRVVSELRFTAVRTVREGPHHVPGKNYRQLRGFDVRELAMTNSAARRLNRELVDAAEDNACPGVLLAGPDDIAHGRLDRALIAPQSAFLLGPARLSPDLPPLR
ncbi:hypothetical protein [Amycolatopsis sp. CA-128772]|uniref:SMODS-associated NUDIX domain-containing protein n=1 Tax=Amycolatopsis sp. CA-128772 TaxID=2073159 RepID=UPI0011B04F39|nr:hypothetical protein [Amycolatopsis sp. CA-128772]